MTLKAILFGSIGVLAETSDMQRRAYNQALTEAGLDWHWDQKTYSELLEMSGGRDRLSLLGRATGKRLSDDQIAAIHLRKTNIAGDIVRAEATLRPGVVALARLAQQKGLKLGFVTSTSFDNIEAILSAEASELEKGDFDVIVTSDMVEHSKPEPDAYRHALEELRIDPNEAVAIEDTMLSMMAAQKSGITRIATPGALTSSQDFHGASLLLANLSDDNGELDPELLTMLGLTQVTAKAA